MKKLLAMFGLLLIGIVTLAYAGSIKDQPPLGGYNYQHGNGVIGSSMTSAGINMHSAPAPGTSQGQNCQTCLTKLILQMTQASTGYILESGTTDYIILGSAIGSSTGALGNTLQINEQHLEPLCAQNGNTFQFNVLPITGSNPATVNYEGFVDCGGSRN